MAWRISHRESTGHHRGPTELSARLGPTIENPPDAANTFSWWFYGLPSAASTLVPDLTSDSAQNAPCPSMVMPASTGTAAAMRGGRTSCDPGPGDLYASVITKGYATSATLGSGTMVVAYTGPRFLMGSTAFQPLTVTLDYSGACKPWWRALSGSDHRSGQVYRSRGPQSVEHLLVPPRRKIRPGEDLGASREER